MLLFSGLSLILTFILAAFSKWQVPQWQQRDFGTRNINWNLAIASSSVLSLAVAHLGFFLSQNIWVSLAIGLVGFLTVLASVTDLAIMKIPSELTTIGCSIPIPFFILLWPSFDYYDKMSIIVWGVLTFVFGVLSLFRLFGWADVKLMFMFAVTLSWWVGPTYMMYAFLGSSVLTLALTPFINKRHGSEVLGIKKHLGDSTVWDTEEKKLVTVDKQPIDVEELEGLGRKEVRAKVKKAKGKKKTFIVFGPGLLVAFLAMSLVAAGTMEVTTFTFFDLPK